MSNSKMKCRVFNMNEPGHVARVLNLRNMLRTYGFSCWNPIDATALISIFARWLPNLVNAMLMTLVAQRVESNLLQLKGGVLMSEKVNYRRGVIFDLSVPEHVYEVLKRLDVFDGCLIMPWSKSKPRVRIEYRTTSSPILEQLMDEDAQYAICYYEDGDASPYSLQVAIVEELESFLKEGSPFDDEPRPFVDFESRFYEGTVVTDINVERAFSCLWAAAPLGWKSREVGDNYVAYDVIILPRNVRENGWCLAKDLAKQPEIPEVLGDIPEE